VILHMICRRRVNSSNKLNLPTYFRGTVVSREYHQEEMCSWESRRLKRSADLLRSFV
jgi:hypothetical protein